MLIILVLVLVAVIAIFASLRRATRATPQQEAEAIKEADERITKIERGE